jgi:hypothetical protein
MFGSCEHDDEPLHSMKEDKFLVQASNYQLLKDKPVPEIAI